MYPKFEVGDRNRILKYKDFFAKVYVLNLSEESLVIKKIKNFVPWTHL